jgi:hypothetical protein
MKYTSKYKYEEETCDLDDKWYQNKDNENKWKYETLSSNSAEIQVEL